MSSKPYSKGSILSVVEPLRMQKWAEVSIRRD